MKKLISIITSVSMLLLCLITPALAAGDKGEAAAVTVSTDGVADDGEYTFTVSAEGLPVLLSVKVVPVFDSSVFELTGGWWHTDAPLADFSVAEGDGVAAWHEPTELSGDVLSFTLRLKGESAIGTHLIRCEFFVINEKDEICETSDVVAAELDLGCDHDFTIKSTEEKYLVDGSDDTYYVSCSKCGEAGDETFTVTRPGDVNGDKKINLADVSLLLKYIAKWDVSLDEDAADVTGDSKINLADASLLLKYIAKWDVVLG